MILVIRTRGGKKARSAAPENIQKLNFVYLQKQKLRFNFKRCKITYNSQTANTFFPN